MIVLIYHCLEIKAFNALQFIFALYLKDRIRELHFHALLANIKSISHCVHVNYCLIIFPIFTSNYMYYNYVGNDYYVALEITTSEYTAYI